MFDLILNLAYTALRIANLVLLVYCVMSFVAPYNDLYRKAAYHIEPLLRPVRMTLYRLFPVLRGLPVDLSPLAVWLLMDVAMMLLNMLRRVF